MNMFPRKYRSFKTPLRGIAGLMAGVFLYTVFLPGAQLSAQTFRRFEDGSRSRLDQKIDRATRLENEQSWSNYVELGIAHERVKWEQEAYEEVQKQLDEIETADGTDEEKQDQAREVLSRFEAAADAWQDDAGQLFLEERGKFRARKEGVAVAEIDTNDYESMIAAAEAAVVANPEAGLAGWEDAIAGQHQAIQQAFEDELAGELDRARNANTNLSAAERQAFEEELARVEEELREEFAVRDNFFVVRARNRYIALLRNDDLNARLASEQAGADAVGEGLIEDTQQQLASETEDRLAAAVDSTAAALEGATTAEMDAVGQNWESEIEAVIDSGLRKWEKAEEDLYKRRLVWQEENKRTREEAEAIWRSNHEKLKTARDDWLKQVEQQIAEGRAQWQEKFAEFDQNREKAERELAEHIQAQREAWDASSQELANIITGGGSALLEAKDAYRYYETLLEIADPESVGRDAELYAFYQSERDYMAGAVGRFQRILSEAEGVVSQQMHSGENYTGLLNDVRLYAGDLPEVVANLDEEDFRAALTAEMNARGEDFLLYRRDLTDLAERNAVFVERADDLKISPQFDYRAAAGIDDLGLLVLNLDRKYDEHRNELTAILDKNRDDLPDDTARLAAIKTEIEEWFAANAGEGAENARLKRKTVAYFNDGLGGYYLTGNEGDPYLMTRAEYEWELLRRERNYLAKKLRRAEAVKSYADLAYQHEAGLEMGKVTAERARIAEIQADLKELEYQLIRGDIDLDPDVYTDPAKTGEEYDRLLADHDIQDVLAREERLNDERAALQRIAAFKQGEAATAADVQSFIDEIDEVYFAKWPAGQEERADLPLGILRSKLIAYRDRLEAGGDPSEIAARWTVVGGGAQALANELDSLHADYDFPNLRETLANIRTRVSERTLPMLQGDIAAKKAQIEANAQLLAQAKVEMERAKTAYREARIDYDVLRASNREDLIRIELGNTSRALAGVLNSMSKIEDIPGMQGRLWDPVTEGQAKYVYEVSLRETAQQDLAFSADVLSELEGLEESKQRLATLETLLADNDLGALEPDALAELFINKESELVNRDAAAEAYRSQAEVTSAMDGLKQAGAAFAEFGTQLQNALDEGAEAGAIEILRAQKRMARESIYARVETLIAAQRGEERGRRDAVLHLLGEQAGSGDPWPEELRKKTETVSEAHSAEIFALAETGAARLASFLSENEGATYADLLKLVNDRLDAANPALDTSRTGYGDAAAQNRETAEWKMVRSFLLSNRNLIEYANNESDGRPVDEKWAAVLDQVADLADDADYYQEFQDSIPDSGDHAWVTAYRDERETLRDAVVAALAAADPAAAYLALPSADRETLVQYGLYDPLAPLESLQAMRKAIDTDLAALDTNYRETYLRVEGGERSREVQAIQLELADVGRRLEEAEQERAALVAEKKTAGPALIPAIDARIAELDARIAPLEPVVEALEDRMRVAATFLKELQQPGSSSALVNLAVGQTAGFELDAMLLDAAQKRLSALSEKRREEPVVSSADRVKAVIGFYRTDEEGEILRDENGVALVSQEFQDLGLSDPAVNLLDVIGGKQKGTDLMRWAERLTDWSSVKENRDKASPELVAAISLLENGIREVVAARAIIEHRYDNGAALKSQAKADADLIEKRQAKLARLRGLESSLAEAVRGAEQNQQDPVAAALAILENPDNITTLLLFDGFDEEGRPDGVTDEGARERVEELKRLAKRLRAARLAGTVTGAAAKYAEIKSQYTEALFENPFVVEPGREAFLAAYPQLNGESLIADVEALPATDFRAKLLEWLRTTRQASGLFDGEIIGHLQTTVDDGETLKSDLVALLEDFQSRIENDINVNLDPIDRITLRDRDLRVRTGVDELITQWSTRADQARALLDDGVDGLDEAADLNDNKILMAAEIDALLEEPVLAGLRQEIIPIVNTATSSAELKTNLRDYLDGLTNPAAADLAELRTELYTNDLRRALTISDATTEFDGQHYSDELRAMIALRAYEKANERLADYQKMKNADTEAVRAAASLDLAGINGDLANWILVRDFDEYAAGHAPADLIAAGEGNRAMDDYLGEYFADRGTGPDRIQDGGAEIAERLALREYQRIQSAAAVAGGLHKLDDRAYFADFKGYLFLARVEDYVARNGVVPVGATLEARAADFRGHFDAMLGDATYAGADGKTLGQRLLLADEREAYFQLAFNYIEYGGAIDQQLPGALNEHRLYDTLDLPPPAADEYLPEALTNIADYANQDYRALARAVGPETEAALARIEVIERSMSEDLSLALTDAELAAVVERAGYGDANAALQSELVALVRSHNLKSMAGEATSAEQAVAALRQHKVIAHFFPTGADQERLGLFMAARGDVVEAVESEYFAALENSHADLRIAAKENRGAFFRSVIERSRGTADAYYDALPAEQQARLDEFSTRLFANVTGEQRDSLRNHAADFARVFDLRSGQQLVTSGLFENVENEIMSAVLRGGDDVVLAAARENPAALVTAFIERIYTEEGLQSGPSAASSAFLGNVPGLADLVTRASADMDTALRDMLQNERVLVERFLTTFQESDAERRELREIFTDPARLDPDSALSMDYAVRRASLVQNTTNAELARALLKIADTHERYFEKLSKQYGEDQFVAGKLAEFAELRGEDPDFKDNRFSSYRTYIDVEKPYQEGDYRKYVDDINYANSQEDDPSEWDTPKGFLEYQNGQILKSDSLGHDNPGNLLDGDWESVLISDDRAPAGSVDLGTDTAPADDDQTVEFRSVYTVSSLARRNSFGADYVAEIRHTYFENLANNYLEAISKLNGSLSAVLRAADMADLRESKKGTSEDIVQSVKDAYDVNAAAGVNDLTAVRDLKLDADSRLAEHTDQKISQLQGQVLGIQGGFDKAGREFAGAGRRRQLSTMNQVDFLRTTFNRVRDDFHAAEAQVTALSDQADALREEMAVVQRTHVDRLNLMAETWRDFTFLNDEKETRLAVQEYAETPYLFAAAADSAGSDSDIEKEYRGDAKEEYELALAAYEAAQANLKDASFNVQTQDNLEDFNAIVTGLDAGATYDALSATEREELLELQDRKFRSYETLSDADQTRLTELFRRDLYQKYQELIRTRADHIKHTMRMVRLHKASELVNAEIERRRAAAEEKKRQFETILAQKFYTDTDTQDALDARNAVYKRLAAAVEGGVTNFYNEYKSWYWGYGGWAQDVAGTIEGGLKSGQFNVPRITQGQIVEGLTGTIGAALMPQGDKNAIAKWLGAYGGTLAEFGNFKGVYYAFLNQIGQRDLAHLENVITKSIMQPVATIAQGGWVIGQALINQGQALMGTLYGAPFGAALIATGQGLYWGNYPLYQMAMREMARAEAKYQMQNIFMWVLQMNSIAVSTGESTAEVWKKHQEYLDAQARLEYFTKVSDMQTMKERMIQYGQAHQDDPNDHGGDPGRPALYGLTDEDLKYLFDRPGGTDPNYIDSSGNGQTLSAEERNESLDVTANKRVVEYVDTFGTRYDPATIRYDQPGPLEGGVYKGADGDYVRIKTSTHNDNTTYAFAKIKADGAADDRAYDLGDVFKKLVAHGQDLRDQRRDAYLAAGEAHQTAQTFVLNERDQTFETLFARSATHEEGGREFTGYGMTFEDYAGNGQRVAEAHFTQSEALQKKEWDLRRQELQDRFDSWEKRLATIVERGRKSWAGSEDRFLQQWRQWERDFDQEEAEGRKKWDDRIAEHFKKKEEWETETRAQAAEKTIEFEMSKAVDQLNSQLAAAERNLNMDLDRKDKIAMINDAVQAMRDQLPSGGERLKNINKNIQKFNTNVSIASSAGGDFARAVRGVASEFRSEMQEHQERMKVMNKVKIFEEYRKMLAQFKDQITVQNQRIENQTMTAALSQGYQRVGDRYIKKGGASNAIGIVHAYKWFDVDKVVNERLAATGFSDLQGGALVDFLKNKSEVEVESFFYVQKLAFQSVMEYVQGTGSQAERETSRDVNVIGAFGSWVGKAPDGEKAGYGTQLGGKTLENLVGAGNAGKFMKYGVFGGYGELGSSGARPGGAPLGFYPELDMMGEYVAKQDQKGLASAGGTIDPISATLNQFNPVAMAANIAKDIEVGTKVHGYKRGNMIEGSIMKAAKPVLKVAVNAVAAAVATAGNILAPGAAVALGAAIAVAGNALVDSIQVAEDGRITIKSNATIWRNALISGATTAITGGIAQFGGLAQSAFETAKTVTNLAGDVVRSGFDEGGRFSLERGLKSAGKGAIIGAVGSGFGGMMGGSSVANAFGGALASNTATFAECKSGSKAACAQYDAIQRPGADALGSLINSAGIGQKLVQGLGIKSVYEQPRNKDGSIKPLPKPDPSKSANQHNQQRRATESMWGLGAMGSRFKEGFLGSLGLNDWALDKIGNGMGWVADKFGWEKGGNYFRDGVYRTDEQINDAQFDLADGDPSDPDAVKKLAEQKVKNGDLSPEQAQEALNEYNQERLKYLVDQRSNTIVYDWKDKYGRTTTNYDKLSARMAAMNGVKGGQKAQQQMDVFANFADELIEMGIESPDKIPDELLKEKTKTLQKMIYEGKEIRHFKNSTYTNQIHQTYRSEWNKIYEQRAQGIGFDYEKIKINAQKAGLQVGQYIQQRKEEIAAINRIGQYFGQSSTQTPDYGPSGTAGQPCLTHHNWVPRQTEPDPLFPRLTETEARVRYGSENASHYLSGQRDARDQGEMIGIGESIYETNLLFQNIGAYATFDSEWKQRISDERDAYYKKRAEAIRTTLSEKDNRYYSIGYLSEFDIANSDGHLKGMALEFLSTGGLPFKRPPLMKPFAFDDAFDLGRSGITRSEQLLADSNALMRAGQFRPGLNASLLSTPGMREYIQGMSRIGMDRAMRRELLENGFPMVPGGGLRAHEGVSSIFGHPTHTISSHIGKTEAQLAQRLADVPGLQVVSTFRNQQEAELFLSLAIRKEQHSINQFLARPISTTPANGRLVRNVYLDDIFPNIDTGNILRRNGTLQSGRGVRLVIDRVPNKAGHPYTIVTGFPIQ